MQPTAFHPPKLPRVLEGPLIIGIALVVSNVIMKGPLPFSVGYRFPWKDFLTLIIAIFSIMEANKYVYTHLDKRLPFYQEIGQRLFWQCVGSFGVTLLLFSAIHMIRAEIFHEPLSLKDFIFYGFVAFSISIALNGIHIISYLLRLIKYKENNKLQHTQTGTLAVAMGNRTLLMEPGSISWWHSSGGAVTLIRTDGVQFTTNYASFSEIADKLPDTDFFHLNRQVIAHRGSIESIQNGQNGQLTVQLRSTRSMGPANPGSKGQALTVIVSRYKREAFRDWMDRH
jgi:uncharacterized membrane protein